MSISPFKSGASKSPSSASKAQKLTLSESLLITAGLAGLIGLGGGAIVRFSLSHSPNASFLSPLQTFPTLSSWPPSGSTSESTSDTADAQAPATEDSDRSPEALPLPAFERLAPLADGASDQPSSTSGADLESIDTATFDSFADRQNSSQPADPWETLKRGPDLGIVKSPAEADLDPAGADYDPSLDAADPESSYSGENYEEDYPWVEEPGTGDRAYYEDNGQY
ncbi:hypothetical protein [Leptolyngbya sp. BC1307]|uniref:hypothetical protein n=1 Tax=Leptolyngbya sp. BC1307 TaxID=2029589 RepID=UPI000EFB5368|nr:hypothetical protein [Leptolyngbya sp. BC1307]